MHVLIFFGDRRQELLCDFFRRDGHRVSYYRSKEELLCGLPAADAAILPIPVSRDGMHVTGSDCTLSELVSYLPPDIPILGGRLPPALCKGRHHDLLLDESFTLRNASLTAEGVLRLFYEHMQTALAEADVLIYGYGRIAEALTLRLKNLCRSVTVLARREESRTRAMLHGARALPFASFLPPHTVAVNTVPPPFAPPESECMLAVDLAGTPKEGSRFLAAPGLPGRFFPISAARILYETARGFLLPPPICRE